MFKKITNKFLNKEVILYIFFGICTMILNTVSYTVFYTYLNWSNVFSTVCAWLIAVIGAYISNKIWVFESTVKEYKSLIKELFNFFLCRVITGIADVVIMYLGVDVFDYNSIFMKILANVVVVVSNYIASKFWIFKKTSKKDVPYK